MKIGVLLLLSGSLFLNACAQRGKKGTETDTTTSVTTTQTSAGTGKALQPSITMLRMNRTGCFGKCPTYYVDIQSNGMASFHGIRFTEYEGIWQKQLPAEACQKLMRKFELARVDTCADNYEAMVTDLPSINYVFRYAGGGAKNIQNASYGPDFLNTLAQEVDELVRVDNTWKQTAKTATYE
jgi:hypothetical protein